MWKETHTERGEASGVSKVFPDSCRKDWKNEFQFHTRFFEKDQFHQSWPICLVNSCRKSRNPLRSLKKKATEDKENIILLPVDSGLSTMPDDYIPYGFDYNK